MERLIICLFTLIMSISGCFAEQTRIMIIMSSKSPEYEIALTSLKLELENSENEFRYDSFQVDQLEMYDFLREIDRSKPVLILAVGTKALKFVEQKSIEIPILFMMVLDPQLKRNTARTRNVSGVCLDIPLEVQIRYLCDALPDLKTVSMLYHPESDSMFIKDISNLLENAGVNLSTQAIKTEDDIPQSMKQMDFGDVLYLTPNPRTISYSSLKYIMMYCKSNQIPIVGLSEVHVKMGALLAVSADYTDMGCQTGQLALNILEHPEKKYGILYPQNYKIYINKRVADLFGLKISAKLMKQATKIYN